MRLTGNVVVVVVSLSVPARKSQRLLMNTMLVETHFFSVGSEGSPSILLEESEIIVVEIAGLCSAGRE